MRRLKTKIRLVIALQLMLWVPSQLPASNFDDREALALAATEIRESKSPDLDLLGKVIGLQLSLGDHRDAKRNFDFLRANHPDDGKSTGPLHGFFINAAYTQNIDEFKSTIKFLDENSVGGSIHARWMKITMISRAARNKQFELAREILVSMLPEFPVHPEDPIYMGAEFLIMPLYTSGKVKEALEVISLFSDFSGRENLGEYLSNVSKHESKVVKGIDALLVGASPGVEIHWCQHKFKAAISADDPEAAIEMYNRCQKLGDPNVERLKPELRRR